MNLDMYLATAEHVQLPIPGSCPNLTYCTGICLIYTALFSHVFFFFSFFYSIFYYNFKTICFLL